ncbi:MAG: Na+/H+ antiporter NhaA [Actinomycetota bacterium]
MADTQLAVRRETWSGSDNPLARAVARPMVKFLAQETASGVLLLVATVVALVWVNGPLGESYERLWSTQVSIDIGSGHLLDLTLEQWVNDALITLFFFVVGMEIKSELVNGELSDRRVATLPAVAALGGMVVPALIYLAINAGSTTASGWGVPMATDIAFAVGVLALLGPRIPTSLKLFLLTLAIVDDIGAIVVIALFYTADIAMGWLALAAALLVLVVLLRRARVWYTPVYVIIGLVIWFATHESGVHATIAGVILGLLTPAVPLLRERAFEQIQNIVTGETADPAMVREANWRMREAVPLTARLTGLLSPWTSFVIIPIFALANAGVPLSSDALSGAVSSSVTWGVVIGLVVGKPLGVYLFALVALRADWARLPAGLRHGHLLGGGAVAGIGFTVALFIANLAFTDDAVVDAAVIGILVASAASSVVGWTVLRSVATVDEVPEPATAIPVSSGDKASIEA